MASVTSILADIATLSKAEINVLKNHFAKMFLKSATTLEEMVKDNRFSGGMALSCMRVYPYRPQWSQEGRYTAVCMP